MACGSAYHVGMSAKYILESLADIPVEVDLASEFRYRDPKLIENSMVIVISQSGETADSLAALRLSKEKGRPVLGVVNVIGSSIARDVYKRQQLQLSEGQLDYDGDGVIDNLMLVLPDEPSNSNTSGRMNTY